MNREQMLLVKLGEEAAEIIQLTAKAIRFGLHNVRPDADTVGTNEERLREEILDLLAVIEIMKDEHIITTDVIDLQRRKRRIEKYFNVSKTLGILEP